MRLRSKKTLLNYAPEGTPPMSERKKINIALYLYIVALVLFSTYVLFIVYTKIRYEEYTGFIHVPKVVVKTYGDGIVEKVFAKNGMKVNEGQPLFLIKYPAVRKLPVSAKYRFRLELDNLRFKLNSVEAKLKHISNPDILRIDREISSVYVQIVSRKSMLKALERLLVKKRELGRTSKPLELSTIDPNILDNMQLRIERLKATILSLESALKSLKNWRKRLIEMARNNLILKEKTLKKNIELLATDLKSISRPVLETDLEEPVKSQISGRVVQLAVTPDQSVVKGDSLAVIVPDQAKIKFLLFAGQKRIKYLQKGIELTLILADDRELRGTLVDIHTAALTYQPKLTKRYWPSPSPVEGEIEVKNPPKDLVLLDGLKIKAVVERKLWNIF